MKYMPRRAQLHTTRGGCQSAASYGGMTMKLTLLSGAAMAAALVAGAASAQDPSAAPAYGSTQLSAGFPEDPTSIGVRAGGAIYGGNVSDGCSGYVTHQPSYNLNYAAGGLPLFISAASDADAVLLVNAPDGSWHCNDDAYGAAYDGDLMGVNPGVEFADPQSGDYRIWVGTYGSGSGYEPAMLHISEFGFFSDNVFSRAPRGNLPPVDATLNLRGGFSNDPRTVQVRAGGDLDGSRGTGDMCWGRIDEAPDVWVNYDARNAERLYFSLQSDVDTTVFVQSPDGAWHCDDDTAGDLNPGVRIDDPASGRYAVWAGRYSAGAQADATLYVSELGFLGGVDEPAVLDYSLPSNSGSADLRAGFVPDPYNVDVTAGGTVDVYEAVGRNCRGFATTAPDFDLTYEAGDFDLYISASSAGDATMVVNAPDGSWHCDDDGAGSLNPGLRFENPASGRYDIWVGTYSEGAPEPATLHISELGFGGDFTQGVRLDPSLPPNFGDMQLEAGFQPDPAIVDVVAGGPVAAEMAADQSCRGYVSQAPDFALDFQAGSLPLFISAVSDADTTLVVSDPAGNWLCNDDGAGDFNPGLHIQPAQSGVYHVWVGTYLEGLNPQAQLMFSEIGYGE